MELIQNLSATFAEQQGIFRLLVRILSILHRPSSTKIVDSIMALFRTDYSGRGELSERQQKLNSMLSKLTKMSEEFNVSSYGFAALY